METGRDFVRVVFRDSGIDYLDRRPRSYVVSRANFNRQTIRDARIIDCGVLLRRGKIATVRSVTHTALCGFGLEYIAKNHETMVARMGDTATNCLNLGLGVLAAVFVSDVVVRARRVYLRSKELKELMAET